MYYDFKCKSCEEVEEKSIPMDEYKEQEDKQICSKCGGKMIRILTPIGGTFYNCGGFYDTDYRGVSGR